MWIDLKIERLQKANWNYKKEDATMMRQLVKSIQENGFLENLIVREVKKDRYEVINGNHRLDALRELNWEYPVKCYNLGKISLTQAKKIAIETNETRFKSDPDKLLRLLDDIKLEYDISDMPVISNVEIDDLIPEDIKDVELDYLNSYNVRITFTSKELLNEFTSYFNDLDKSFWGLKILEMLRKEHKQ